MRRISGLDLWTVPAWSLQNKEVFRIGLQATIIVQNITFFDVLIYHMLCHKVFDVYPFSTCCTI